MGKLKLAFVLDDTLDTPDGVQQYILTLGGWLSQQGHEVHYLVGRTERTDIPHVHSVGRNVRVRFNGNRMSTPLPASRYAIRQLLQREKFDVIHVQMPYSPFMAGRVIAAAPASTAVVGTFHIAPNSTMVSMANHMLGRMVRRSLRRFDAVFSVSQAAVDFARQTYGLETTVLPNVVQVNDYAAAKPFKKPAGEQQIVYVGRLVPRKGCQILLEAFSLLLQDEAMSPCRLVICGRGPLEEQLKQYVDRQNLSEAVTFTGFVSEADKARHLKTADVAVFPSTGGESFGIVLLEAMAAGHPVVLAANNPGYATVMQPHPTSLFPVKDAKALADTLRKTLHDTHTSEEVIQWQQSYIGQFDVSVVGRRLVARYMEALRSRGQ